MESWSISPEQQLERVKQLNTEHGWGFLDSDFPSVPKDFIPRTPTEVLMLNVCLPRKRKQPGLPCTFDELWRVINAPNGYTKWRWEPLKLLRQAPGYTHKPGISWVAFDPNTYRGLSPEAALKQSKTDGVRLAGTEVLMAALLFHDWVTSWNGDDSLYPHLSGLQSSHRLYGKKTGWSHVPFLDRRDDLSRLGLSTSWAHNNSDSYSSPVVREC